MGGTALITGASSGLGAELARLFAADGHDLVLVARRGDRLAALGDELSGRHGVRARVVTADLGAPDGPARVVQDVLAAGNEVDFLVNNAGFGATGGFTDLDADRQLEMIRVNVTAVVALTRALLPGMLARRRGRVLNVGSTAGFVPGPRMAVYYATKAFVNSFSEALAREVKGTGVTVTVSCPGATDTEFAGVAGNDRSLLFRLGAASAPKVAAGAYRAMMAGRPMVVHGAANKALIQLLRLGPRALVRTVTAALNGAR